MKTLFVSVLALFALGTTADAALSPSQLDQVGLSLGDQARLPLGLMFQDDAGRPVRLGDALKGHPALVIPVDYTCKSTCGTALTLTSDALGDSGLKPNIDFRLIVVGIDPKDRPADARHMAAAEIHRPAIAAASAILLGDAPVTHAFLHDIGYRAVYDPATDQFAHPAIVLAVTKDGRIARALSSLAFDPTDLRLALVDAGEGQTGTLGDRLRSICYGFDAAHGLYTPMVQRLLVGTGLLTLSLLGVFLMLVLGLPKRWLRRS